MTAAFFGRTLAPVHQVVRMAKIVVDPARLDEYKAALMQDIDTSVRVEPGVLQMFAVYEKGAPHHVTLLEVYADDAAYQAHLQTPHFLKYKATTREWVQAVELLEMGVIGLEIKKQ